MKEANNGDEVTVCATVLDDSVKGFYYVKFKSGYKAWISEKDVKTIRPMIVTSGKDKRKGE